MRCSDTVVDTITDTVADTDTADDLLFTGKGADHPKVRDVLSEFSDVLVSKLPPGDPPERLGLDGIGPFNTLSSSLSTPNLSLIHI